MSLIKLENIYIDFGDQVLLDHIDLTIENNERICLIGRNGTGKTTLLKTIAGIIKPDSGKVLRQPNIQIAQLDQSFTQFEDKSVFEIVAGGLHHLRKLVTEYQQLSDKNLSPKELNKLEQLQQQIEVLGGWNFDQKIEAILSTLKLPKHKNIKELSGGWQRRVALGKALVSNPDLLLLDEPTNHLDINTIEWLEKQIENYKGSVLFITHDRAFLQSLATRILELDRGILTTWKGDYQYYLEKKEKILEEQSRQNSEFDKKLAQEEAWVRQGIKARRTRNEGRVSALKRLREERAQRREKLGNAKFQIEDAQLSGKRVIEAHKISFQFNEQPLINKFSVKILRGDRVGLVGNNGVGKSTLLKLLLGELHPQQGKVKHGTNLEVAFFDQHRSTLDPEKTVIDNLGEGREFITINGKDRHVISYLSDFLFSPRRIRSPVKSLSGGECNRLLLAQLLAKPANLLVLDEPTNDLDIETLEILEQRLVDFKGTLIIVSHDRTFLDNVVTSTLVFESDNLIEEYVGGYQDWMRHKKQLAVAEKENQESAPTQKTKRNPINTNKALNKLSYKFQRELDNLPQQIEQLETKLSILHQNTTESDFFTQPKQAIQKAMDEIKKIEDELHTATERWEELELMKSNSNN